MNIDESQILIPDNYNEELALACLLAADICYLGEVYWEHSFIPIWIVAVYVNASDIFAWGCADCEIVQKEEIIDLYKYWKENENWGREIWLCLKRNEQPQEPVKNLMVAAGSWNETLEALPENNYDKHCREAQYSKQQ